MRLLLLLVVLCRVWESEARSTAHSPRSRLHKLDCKVSRRKVLGSVEEEGTALVIGASAGFSKSNYNEELWKFFSSKKMNFLRKVFVEPYPEYFSQLQINILKSKMTNASAIHAAVVSRKFYESLEGVLKPGVSPSASLFCNTIYPSVTNGRVNESSTSKSSQKRLICSMNLNQPVVYQRFSPKSAREDPTDDAQLTWSKQVPIVSLAQLVEDVTRSEKKGTRDTPLRWLTLDTDDDMDYQLLQDFSNSSKVFRPSVISVNYGSFSQEQLDSSLQLLHGMQYVTCIAKKRKVRTQPAQNFNPPD